MKTLKSHPSVYTPHQIASVCDHSFLKTIDAYAYQLTETQNSIQLRQNEFLKFLHDSCEGVLQPYGICVQAADVPHARQFIDRHQRKSLSLIAMVGFPDGSWHKKHYKFMEAQYALNEGANEVDMPLNWKALKQGEYGIVLEELETVCSLVHQKKGIFKMIIDPSLLDPYHIREACKIARHISADFITISTDYGAYGVQLNHLAFVLDHWDGGIKISGEFHLRNVSHCLEIIQTRFKEPDQWFNPHMVRIGESKLLKELSKSA